MDLCITPPDGFDDGLAIARGAELIAKMYQAATERENALLEKSPHLSDKHLLATPRKGFALQRYRLEILPRSTDRQDAIDATGRSVQVCFT